LKKHSAKIKIKISNWRWRQIPESHSLWSIILNFCGHPSRCYLQCIHYQVTATVWKGSWRSAQSADIDSAKQIRLAQHFDSKVHSYVIAFAVLCLVSW